MKNRRSSNKLKTPTPHAAFQDSKIYPVPTCLLLPCPESLIRTRLEGGTEAYRRFIRLSPSFSRAEPEFNGWPAKETFEQENNRERSRREIKIRFYDAIAC